MSDTPSRLCDLCEQPFVPEPFADPEVCVECQETAADEDAVAAEQQP